MDEYNVRYEVIMIDQYGIEHQKFLNNKVTALAWARREKAKKLIIKTRDGRTLVEYKRSK